MPQSLLRLPPKRRAPQRKSKHTRKKPRNGMPVPGLFCVAVFSTLHKFRSVFLAMVRMDSEKWL